MQHSQQYVLEDKFVMLSVKPILLSPSSSDDKVICYMEKGEGCFMSDHYMKGLQKNSLILFHVILDVLSPSSRYLRCTKGVH